MNNLCKFTAIISLLTIICSVANAQTSNFTGASFGGNIEFKSTTLKLSASGSEFSGLGNQNMIGSISADYGFEIGNDSVLLVGGKYDLQNTTVVSITDSSGTVKLEEKEHYSIFAAPGILLNDKTLGYAKLSYESSKIDASGLKNNTIGAQSVTGIGYGLGVRTHITGNWYANLEAGRIVYSGKAIGTSTLTTGTTVGLVGLSYKF
jgi:opacity protein-like surface antigen